MHTPRDIVCLQPSATVILSAVGALDRVVACTRYCADVVPEIAGSNRVIVADSWTAKAKQILSAKPDLVIAAVPYQDEAVREILKAGVRFLGLAPKNLNDIYTDIATISGLVDAASRGDEVIASMRQQIEQIRLRSNHGQRPRVFCEEWGKPLITSQAWVAELVAAAGGRFLGEPGRQVSAEEVRQGDPEVIVAAWCGAGDRVPLEKIIADRGWHDTSAARVKRVFCIRDEFLNTPAPTLIEGLKALAFAIHPEVFPCANGLRQINDGEKSTVPNSAA